MALTHTLTAYRCTFDYVAKNNINITDEIKEKIKNGEKPIYSLSDFVNDYIDSVSSLAIGKNANRAIQLTNFTSSKMDSGVLKIHIQPKAGKYGENVTVVEKSTKKAYNYKEDDAALYGHNIFFFEKDCDIIAIFYRKGTSGCKTVFYETANDTLRSKGMKLEMSLIMPFFQKHNLQKANATKLIVQWVEPKRKSSDIADELDDDKPERKTTNKVIQKLEIRLKENHNNQIKSIIEKLTSGQIVKEAAFAEIKTKCLGEDNRDKYNDALIQFKIGNKDLPPLRFGDIENQIGAYDITNLISESDFINSLISNADDYYRLITEEQGEN